MYCCIMYVLLYVCVKVRKQLLSFHHVDPGDWTQVVRLGSSAFTGWDNLLTFFLLLLEQDLSLQSSGWSAIYYVV